MGAPTLFSANSNAAYRLPKAAPNFSRCRGEVKPHRTFGKPLVPKPVKPPKPTKLMVAERPRVMQRRVPSLPRMPWQDDGAVARRVLLRVRPTWAAGLRPCTVGPVLWTLCCES